MADKKIYDDKNEFFKQCGTTNRCDPDIPPDEPAVSLPGPSVLDKVIPPGVSYEQNIK